MDANLTGLHKDTTMISIGLVTENDETFYAELNDYDEVQVNEWAKENIIHNLLYSAPPEDQDEYWSWGENNKFQMRGKKQEVGRYLTDWFQALLGGPQSWVAYDAGHKPKEVTKQSIELWGYCLSYDWVLMNDLWGSVGMTAPRCLYHIPYDLATCLKIVTCPEEYLRHYEASENALVAARAIQVWHMDLEKEVKRKRKK